MTVTFVTNFLNHHQLPFCLEMQKLTGGNFTFVAFEPLANEQMALGYENMNELPFVIRAYESDAEYQKAREQILNADVAIFGSCPENVIQEREKTGKYFLIYSERFFKKGTYRRFIPMTYRKIYKKLLRYEKSNMGVLCASAYLPYDIQLLGKKFKTYKWGYFPEVKRYGDFEKIVNQKEPKSILWVARFIKWKHPEAIIKVAKRLKKDGYNFKLTLIGRGPIEQDMKKLAMKSGLEEDVIFTGAMPPNAVREYMKKNSIFVCTSDQNEGWGAVMNEALNSACAVVASYAVGSVPFLVEDGKNGLIYRSGSCDDLYQKVRYLLDNESECKRMQHEAYTTMIEKWCAENATKRLYDVCFANIAGEIEPVYEDGPMSYAETIKPVYKGTKL